MPTDFLVEIYRYAMAQSIIELATNREEEEALKEYAEEKILVPYARFITD